MTKNSLQTETEKSQALFGDVSVMMESCAAAQACGEYTPELFQPDLIKSSKSQLLKLKTTTEQELKSLHGKSGASKVCANLFLNLSRLRLSLKFLDDILEAYLSPLEMSYYAKRDCQQKLEAIARYVGEITV